MSDAPPPVEAAEGFVERARHLGVSVESVLAVPGVSARLRVETTSRFPGPRTVTLLNAEGDFVVARGGDARLLEPRGTRRGRLSVLALGPGNGPLVPNDSYRLLVDLAEVGAEVAERLLHDPHLAPVLESEPWLSRSLALRETNSATHERTLRLLEEVAAGTPLEWALRHHVSAGSVS